MYSHLMENFNRGLPGLKRIREAKGLSQNKLAASLGVTATQIYRVESGRSDASQALIRALAERLEVTAAQLFTPDPHGAGGLP